jgi:topoisomerase-4 subunit A
VAKGHDIDPTTLAYRSGDEFLDAARGRSNQQAVFLDSSGRAYALTAHTLPSARGLGEPLTSRFTLPEGARFCHVLAGDTEQKLVLASSFGYGFVTELGNLHNRMKAGKAMLSLRDSAEPVTPAIIGEGADTIVCATSDGYLLAFPLAELPELGKGKGNKLIQVPPARLKAGEELMVGMAVIGAGQEILVWAGKQYLRMSTKDLEHYRSDRAKRGRKLPKGYQRVTRIELAEQEVTAS